MLRSLIYSACLLVPASAFATLDVIMPEPVKPTVNDSGNEAIALAVGIAIVGFALFGNGFGGTRGKSLKKQNKVAKADSDKVIEKF